MKLIESILKVAINPSIIIKHVWRNIPLGGIEIREKFDAFKRPSYAWGMLRAAKLAKGLGESRISCIEFGVASGNGLLQMDEIASMISREMGIEIDVYGFDSGVGLLEVSDYRDMPYHWSPGDYPMPDADKLRGGLKRGELIIGDVIHTIQDFMVREIAPIGFISFDLDLYTPTKAAMRIFDIEDCKTLPRVYAYFDDIMGADADCNEYTGELLAIKEFNANNANKKIAPINGFVASRIIKSVWNGGAYTFHNFEHKDYCKRVYL